MERRGSDRPRWQEGATNIGVISANMGVIRGASGISRLLGAAKLQSAPGADNHVYNAAGSSAPKGQ